MRWRAGSGKHQRRNGHDKATRETLEGQRGRAGRAAKLGCGRQGRAAGRTHARERGGQGWADVGPPLRHRWAIAGQTPAKIDACAASGRWRAVGPPVWPAFAWRGVPRRRAKQVLTQNWCQAQRQAHCPRQAEAEGMSVAAPLPLHGDRANDRATKETRGCRAAGWRSQLSSEAAGGRARASTTSRGSESAQLRYTRRD